MKKWIVVLMSILFFSIGEAKIKVIRNVLLGGKYLYVWSSWRKDIKDFSLLNLSKQEIEVAPVKVPPFVLVNAFLGKKARFESFTFVIELKDTTITYKPMIEDQGSEYDTMYALFNVSNPTLYLILKAKKVTLKATFSPSYLPFQTVLPKDMLKEWGEVLKMK